METLDIRGQDDGPVPNTFLRADRETRHLGIILPGMGYGVQAPLLWYPTHMLQAHGADVLLLEYAYSRDKEFAGLSQEDQLKRLNADVDAAVTAGLGRRSYNRVSLIGKSLGTLAMGHLLTTEQVMVETRAVWLTPLLRLEHLVAQIKEWSGPSLFVIGTDDPHYDPALLDEAQAETRGESVVIEGADHAMSVGGDIWKSIDALERVLYGIQGFLAPNFQEV